MRLPVMIDATQTVNDVLRQWPETMAAFNSLGVDICCGGADSLAAAAMRIGIPVEDLINVLSQAIEPEGARS